MYNIVRLVTLLDFGCSIQQNTPHVSIGDITMPTAFPMQTPGREKKNPRKIAWKYRNQLKRIDVLHILHTQMSAANVSVLLLSISLHFYISLVCLFIQCLLFDCTWLTFFSLHYATDSHLWHCNKLIFFLEKHIQRFVQNANKCWV